MIKDLNIKVWIALIAMCTFLSCKKNYVAPVPDTTWQIFNTPTAKKLVTNTRNKLEGIYIITEGSEVFGVNAALKWSYTITEADTLYHLSMFCEKQVVYMICEGKRLDSSVLLNGYWRNMLNTETGIVRFNITSNSGAKGLLDSTTSPLQGLTLSGSFGIGEAQPINPVSLQYQRPLYNGSPLEIIAHRGGGRTADLLPASENSAEIIKLASRFGATGIEIDVRLTSDGVPVLYHDGTLNERLIQKNGLIGPIENYSYRQLTDLVRLIKGEKIPTLRQALDVVLYQTNLKFVWLDTKYDGNMTLQREILEEYQQKAIARGRNLSINIGIPDEMVLKNFKKLNDFRSIPSICELSPQDVTETNAAIWAPRWTLGLQPEETARMQTAGRKVFVWTLDVPENINKYFNEGNFNGILSNYPSSVAYFYYAKQ